MVSRSTDKHCLTYLWSIAPKGNFSLDCHREDGSQAETECSMSQQANKNLVARYARRFAIICGECKVRFRIFATRSTR